MEGERVKHFLCGNYTFYIGDIFTQQKATSTYLGMDWNCRTSSQCSTNLEAVLDNMQHTVAANNKIKSEKQNTCCLLWSPSIAKALTQFDLRSRYILFLCSICSAQFIYWFNSMLFFFVCLFQNKTRLTFHTPLRSKSHSQGFRQRGPWLSTLEQTPKCF